MSQSREFMPTTSFKYRIMHKRRCKITWPLKDYFSSSRKKDTKIFILQFLPHRLHLQLNLKDESVLCFLLRVFSFESYDKTQC